MSRADLAVKVARLRADGLLQREAAASLGISRSYANDLEIDPDGSKSRARKMSYSGTCEKCGARTYGGDGPARAPKLCATCTQKKQHDERYWTRERVREAILRFARENSRPPLAHEWIGGRHGRDGDGYPYTSIVLREYGKWADAIEAAGFPRPAVGKFERSETTLALMRQPRVSTETYIERLRVLSTDGLAPSTSKGPARAIYEQLWRRGIRWSDACALAGTRPRRKMNP